MRLMFPRLHLKGWVKPAVTLIILAILAWLAPVKPMDPFHLLSPKKIISMIWALVLIQSIGSVFARYLGARTGSILTGFLGGLVSSTATTASLARKSKLDGGANTSSEMLTFLSATGAMLFEGLALLITGAEHIHLPTLLVFIGPIATTIGLILVHYQKSEERGSRAELSDFQILPLLKLSVFIVAILAVSKLFQNIFGQNGLLILTWIVSLFEIHGSIIANVNLHESGAVTLQLLCSLLVVSVFASYLSKLFLISTLGSSALRLGAIKSTFILFCSLGLSWLAAVSMAR